MCGHKNEEVNRQIVEMREEAEDWKGYAKRLLEVHSVKEALESITCSWATTKSLLDIFKEDIMRNLLYDRCSAPDEVIEEAEWLLEEIIQDANETTVDKLFK